MTNLSKAFDCLSHELLIAKLAAYGFCRSASKLMYTYPFNGKQRTKTSILLAHGKMFYPVFHWVQY